MADLILHVNARTLDGIMLQLKQTPLNDAETVMDRLALVYMNNGIQNFNRWRIIFDDRILANAVTSD